VPSTYTTMNDPDTASMIGRALSPVTAAAASVAVASAATTTRLRRGTAPGSAPRANQAGNAPSRPSAAPRRAAPAK
jgi:hypothetical protein